MRLQRFWASFWVFKISVLPALSLRAPKCWRLASWKDFEAELNIFGRKKGKHFFLLKQTNNAKIKLYSFPLEEMSKNHETWAALVLRVLQFEGTIWSIIGHCPETSPFPLYLSSISFRPLLILRFLDSLNIPQKNTLSTEIFPDEFWQLKHS